MKTLVVNIIFQGKYHLQKTVYLIVPLCGTRLHPYFRVINCGFMKFFHASIVVAGRDTVGYMKTNLAPIMYTIWRPGLSYIFIIVSTMERLIIGNVKIWVGAYRAASRSPGTWV